MNIIISHVSNKLAIRHIKLTLVKRLPHMDTVQPCDMTQARSDLDFSVKYTTIQVYDNSHNS